MIKTAGIFLCFLLFSVFPAMTTAASECNSEVLNEELSYDISFLIFSRAADAVLTIHRRPDKDSSRWYEAVLEAKTRGFVGLLRSTEHTYRSLMRFDEEGNHLLSIEFRKDVIWGLFSPTKRSTRFVFDESKRVIMRRSEIDGTVELVEDMVIPKGIGRYEDLLSALYNLRNGVYGPLLAGRDIILHTVPFPKKYGRDKGKKIDRFTIHIATEKEKSDYRAEDKADFDLNTLVFIDVPAGLFDDKKSVRGRIWADACLTPTLIIVEDVMIFGDVIGRLKK